MNKLKISGKLPLITASVAAVIGISIALAMTSNHGSDLSFSPTTLAQAQRVTERLACLEDAEGPNLNIGTEARSAIENMVVSSIIDVPAGTNVDVYLRTYDGASATGLATYAGRYGSYNFTAKHTSGSTDSSFGGWKIIRFDACQQPTGTVSAETGAPSFLFKGASDWSIGPRNNTSLALFYEPGSCFASIEYKLGKVDAAAEIQKTLDALAGAGYAVTPISVQTLATKTSTGSQDYELHQYAVTGSSDSGKLYGGQEFGYFQIGNGHIKIQGYCESTDALSATIPALQAIELDIAN